MNHGSLFSGIGGFDLAAEWMGWNNLFHCEWNPFGQKVLKHYWPEAESFNDITKTDFTQYANRISILTGGFPCQPYSSAGKRKGKDDERHLWPEMLRAIREIRPRWVVGENVLGLVNWSGGLVFHEVQADLEAEGYEVQPFLLPAAAVGAPHRRDRIWFVAYSDNNRHKTKRGKISKENEISRIDRQEMGSREFNRADISWNATNTVGRNERSGKYRGLRSENAEANRERTQTIYNAFGSNGNKGNATDTEQQGLQGCTDTGKVRNKKRNVGRKGYKFTAGITSSNKQCKWHNFPTQSPICGGDDGLPTELDGITFPKWRAESIKGYGNAIVPQVVYQIFKAIQEYENSLSLQ
jgi:DNA (cytosine-5)-methyltransferase 1